MCECELARARHRARDHPRSSFLSPSLFVTRTNPRRSQAELDAALKAFQDGEQQFFHHATRSHAASACKVQHLARASADAGSHTQHGQFWKVVIRHGYPCNPPAGYEDLENPEHRLRVSSLLAKHLQPRLAGGLSLSEVVDLCVTLTAASDDGVPPWDSSGIDAGIAGILRSNTAVSVMVKRPETDEEHTLWCMPDRTCSITLDEQNPSLAEFQASFQAGAAAGSASASLNGVGSGRGSGQKRTAPSRTAKEETAHRAQQQAAHRALLQSNQRKEQEKTRDFLENWKLTLQDLLAYGDCMFLSVAQQLLLLDRIHRHDSTRISNAERAVLAQQLRADAVGYMEEHRAEFEPFVVVTPKGERDDGKWNDPRDGNTDKDFLGYCSRMSKQGQCADALSIRGLARAKQLTIQVFHWNCASDDIRISRCTNTEVDGAESVHKPDAAQLVATPGTVNIFHHQWQHGGTGHYNSIEDSEVKRSIEA